MSVSHKTGVTPRSQKNITMFMAESYVGHKLCRDGDLVINTMWAWMAALGVSRQTGIVSPAYGVYRLKAEHAFEPKYLAHLLRSQVYASEYLCRSTGVNASRMRLYPDKFLEIPILGPPAEEQELIVHFLDRADTRIRRAVRAKRMLIALLNEQRQVIIHQAVTRGLALDLPLKDSGSGWIGEIPTHWAVVQTRRVISFITSGSRGWADYYSDDGDVFIQSGNLGRDMSLDFGYTQYVRPPAGSEGIRTRVNRDDVLICITGALTGNVVHVDIDLPVAFVNQHVALLRPNTGAVLPRYLAYVLHSKIGAAQFKINEYGGTKQGLGLDDVKSSSFPLPPLPEQQDIVAELDSQCRRIFNTIQRIQSEITFLIELRTRLISDVVTGKLDVRDAAAQLPSEEDTAEATNGTEVLAEDEDASEDAEIEEVEA